ncbi:hypothetical protein [Brachyspira hyodysenteriae]|nr:hypothetical protein [Brachyspira hyodysenteriae]
MFNTPILLIIFNRLDTSLKVFNRIKEVKPKEFYIASDGGRNIEEHKKCLEVR